jgi:hypothetical protein
METRPELRVLLTRAVVAVVAAVRVVTAATVVQA